MGRALSRYVLPRWLVEESLKSAFYDESLVTEEMIDRHVDLQLREGNRRAIVQRFASSRPHGLETRLAKIAIPTLVLWGDHDRLIPAAHAVRFAELIPDARMIIYENTGQIPMEERPQRSAADVRAFLTSVPPARVPPRGQAAA